MLSDPFPLSRAQILSRANIGNYFAVKPKPGPFILTLHSNRAVLVVDQRLLFVAIAKGLCTTPSPPSHFSISPSLFLTPLHSVTLHFWTFTSLVLKSHTHTSSCVSPSFHPSACHTLEHSGFLYLVVVKPLSPPCPNVHARACVRTHTHSLTHSFWS